MEKVNYNLDEIVVGIGTFSAKLRRLRELNYSQDDLAKLFYREDAIPKLVVGAGQFLLDQGKPLEACQMLQIVREFPLHLCGMFQLKNCSHKSEMTLGYHLWPTRISQLRKRWIGF